MRAMDVVSAEIIKISPLSLSLSMSPSGQQTGDGGFQVLTNLTRDNAGGFIYSSGETYSGE